jgi:hypothetical protein
MFMGLAERVGLTGFLAPREGKKDGSKDAAGVNETNVDISAATAAAATAMAPPPETEEEKKTRLLESQKDREMKAASEEEGTGKSSFAKNQRVHYFHKASDVWMEDCYIVGVHHDDGEDQPYYTIRYKKPDDEEQEPIEKQTTHDRLKYAEWDPELTWKILSKTW